MALLAGAREPQAGLIKLCRSILKQDHLHHKTSEDLLNQSLEEKTNIVQEDSVNTTKCGICLEKLRVGETVVWSETKSCPHIYHMDCLVAFFAKRE